MTVALVALALWAAASLAIAAAWARLCSRTLEEREGVWSRTALSPRPDPKEDETP